MRNFIPLLLAIVIASAGFLRADVPPEAGSVRQSVPLTLETTDDLSDYRFFLESAMGIEEVTVVKGEKTVISPAGRAGAARIVSLLAIPTKSFAKFGDELRSTPSADLKELVDQQKIEGVVKLMSHDFQATLRESERGTWSDPVYRIEKKPGLTATMISGNTATGKQRTSPYSNEPKSSAFWTAVVIGGLLTLAFISIGGYLLRRSRSRALETNI